MTWDKETLQRLQAETRRLSPDQREELSKRLRELGAPGIAFEYMHRGGWRPKSQTAGDGIVGGELDPPIIDQRTGRTRGQKRRKR